MEEQTVINKTERANSFCFRWGNTGTDAKIYFDTLEDLKNGIAIVMEGKKMVESNLGG